LLVLTLPTGTAPANQSFTLTAWPRDTELALWENAATSAIFGTPPSGATLCFDPKAAWLVDMGLTNACSPRADGPSPNALFATTGTLSFGSSTGTDITTKTIQQFLQPDGSTLLISTIEFEAAYKSGTARGKATLKAGSYKTTRDPKCKADVPVVVSGG